MAKIVSSGAQKRKRKCSTGIDSEEEMLRIKHLKRLFFDDSKECGEMVEETMNGSFEKRRSFILDHNPAVAEVLSTYPILRNKEHFLLEFCQITGKAMSRKFYTNLNAYSGAIIFCASTPRAQEIKKNYLEIINGGENEGHEDYMNSVCALLVLPTIFDESINTIAICDYKDMIHLYPWFLCESSVKGILRGEPLLALYVERRKIFESRNFLEAILLAIAAYYVFDIEYPAKLKKTLSVIEKLLLEINNGCDRVCDTVCKRLQSTRTSLTSKTVEDILKSEGPTSENPD